MGGESLLLRHVRSTSLVKGISKRRPQPAVVNTTPKRFMSSVCEFSDDYDYDLPHHHDQDKPAPTISAPHARATSNTAGTHADHTHGLVTLHVPRNDWHNAESRGALWHPTWSTWVAPSGRVVGLEQWVPKIDSSTWLHNALSQAVDVLALKSEDREFGGRRRLFVDLVPSGGWFTTAVSCVSRNDWRNLSKLVVGRSHGTCECCGAQCSDLVVDERWEYTEDGSQRLKRLLAVCSACHEVTHFDVAESKGRGEAALEHFKHVTGMAHDEAWTHVNEAFRVWRQRSCSDGGWKVDLSLLTENGMELRGSIAHMQELSCCL